MPRTYTLICESNDVEFICPSPSPTSSWETVIVPNSPATMYSVSASSLKRPFLTPHEYTYDASYLPSEQEHPSSAPMIMTPTHDTYDASCLPEPEDCTMLCLPDQMLRRATTEPVRRTTSRAYPWNVNASHIAHFDHVCSAALRTHVNDFEL